MAEVIKIKRILFIFILLTFISGCAYDAAQKKEQDSVQENVKNIQTIQQTINRSGETKIEQEENKTEAKKDSEEVEDDLQQVILILDEGYNFYESQKYMDNFPEVDIFFGYMGDAKMIETRSSVYDNGIIGLNQAESVPEDHFNTFYIPQKDHVYSFKIWSISKDFESMPDIAVKIIDVKDNSITFEYNKSKVAKTN